MTTSGDVEYVKSPDIRGQVVVLAMFGLAILAGIFAWGWNYHRGRQSLEFFGGEGSKLIRLASRVELLRAGEEGALDISKAAGLINARASLLSDASYDWSASPATRESAAFTVRFSEGGRSLDVRFDFENQTIRASSTGRIAVLKPKTAAGWQGYLQRQVAPATKS